MCFQNVIITNHTAYFGILEFWNESSLSYLHITNDPNWLIIISSILCLYQGHVCILIILNFIQKKCWEYNCHSYQNLSLRCLYHIVYLKKWTHSVHLRQASIESGWATWDSICLSLFTRLLLTMFFAS